MDRSADGARVPVDVLIQRLDPDLPLPAFAHPGDAGADLFAAEDVALAPGERALVPTGVAIALPAGYAAFVHPRSGLAARHGVTIVNAPGTVDAGYRGEIRVTLLNTDRSQPVSFRRGDRIAQLVIQRVEQVQFHEAVSLPGSARGDGGFGSTGGHAAGVRSTVNQLRRHIQGNSLSTARGIGWIEEGACAVFRRRRREDADQAGAGYPGANATGDTGGGWEDTDETGDWDDAAAGAESADPSAPVPAGLRGGPWDADEAYPERERADFGSLLVPITPMQQVELATDGQRFIWVTVKNGMSELRVHAFAAPRSGGLWQDVRQEIAEELSSAGTPAQETEGPFGTELFAHVAVEPGNVPAGTLPVRFIGIDGPRWLLRGLIIGGAATGAEPVEPFEELLSDIVVVRGDHPMPPRDMLELRLPPEVQQALEQQQQALAQRQAGGEDTEPEEENRFRTDLNPFERGPEFTETR